MMRAKLTIPGRLPDLNDYTRACRTHWAKGHALKREGTEAVRAHAVRQLRGVRFAAPVRISIRWVERNCRRDKDNIASFGRKLIHDALVEAGVLAGDGWAHVAELADSFAVDNRNPRIEITIEEA